MLKALLIVLVAAAGGVVLTKVKLLAKRVVLLSLFLICIYEGLPNLILLSFTGNE